MDDLELFDNLDIDPDQSFKPLPDIFDVEEPPTFRPVKIVETNGRL
jgi:hypothetical protein